MEIEKVFVLGAGFMGNGIAQVAALSGYRVTMCDVSEERLEAGLEAIRSSLGKLVSKERITAEQGDAALANLATTVDMEEAREADLVVEAVPEDPRLKKRVFAELDRICPPHAILASNTSAIPISSLASATSRPERVVGVHFFGPVPLLRLVEIIRGVQTSGETMRIADEWARSLGKETVLVLRDHAGFVANRVNIPTNIEAVRVIEEGLATPEEIDRATGGYEAGVGPMQIIDNAGLDVGYRAALAIYEDTRDAKFLPPPLLRRMVAAGLLGRKSGRGFYDYSTGKRESYFPPVHSGETGEEHEARMRSVLNRLLLPAILEAVALVEAGVASPEDVDRASRLGFNLPLGQLEMADAMGLDTVMETALTIHGETGDPKFLPPPLLRRMVAAGLLGRKSGRGFHSYED
ncbi:3-hydroxyacyl-CoA dehydrogenase [Candidatus Solincola tengchongensis]|uniref:3-hydroxyacyl-CoA dehydrogenase n=1 Tax=Candidatus Solincola tengchongensis TaxID=2900693 RepID=UPI00257F2EA1|nr:3-hydroxyacyl-CoA dehydrogenase [Candidatus Solincola tengchongensis]